MKKSTEKRTLIAAAILTVVSVVSFSIIISFGARVQKIGLPFVLAAFISGVACFLAVYSAQDAPKKDEFPFGKTERKDKKAPVVFEKTEIYARGKEKYEKIFPDMTIDDDSSDEEKELDDFFIMDMLDEDEDSDDE